MAEYFAKAALLPHGWAQNVRIAVDDKGWITAVESGASAGAVKTLDGPVLPGMSNLHSHAFQRAMAGLTERATGEKDSFWTWREIMYGFLRKITPEDQEAIAAQLYVEMLKNGYTGVCEFHYLHHGIDGTAYSDRASASRHVIRAAQTAGIGITHLPVLYAYGGFGGQPPGAAQKRFINTPEQLAGMIASLRRDHAGNDQIRIGLALHSLRAVSPEMVKEAVQAVTHDDPSAPIHIHIAEQIKEVDDCLAWSGKRPVEWLFDNASVDARWCLVHATHMNESETASLAASGAVAGLCPTTEANLGDGIFNLPEYLAQNGRIGVGSDSHISVSAIAELRLLEYGQRLLRRERAVTKAGNTQSVGAALYEVALAGGAQASGRETGAIAAGKRADFLVLDPEHPALLCRDGNDLLDAMIFAGEDSPIRDVYCGGQHVVQNRRHRKEGEILAAYKETLGKLLEGRGEG